MTTEEEGKRAAPAAVIGETSPSSLKLSTSKWAEEGKLWCWRMQLKHAKMRQPSTRHDISRSRPS